jgi:hypothetical protein
VARLPGEVGAEAEDLRRVEAAVRQAVAEAACFREVAALESSRSAPHRGAACAPGSARWEVPAAGPAAEFDALRGLDAGHPCPADRAALGVAAAAWSSARFCLIELDTSRLSVCRVANIWAHDAPTFTTRSRLTTRDNSVHAVPKSCAYCGIARTPLQKESTAH